MNEQCTDFVVSELLSELKSENSRKDSQLKSLYRVLTVTVVIALTAVLLTVAGFLWYLNLYDFSSTTTETTTNSAEGVYAIIDSEGNVVGSDYAAEEIQSLLNEVVDDGDSSEN